MLQKMLFWTRYLWYQTAFCKWVEIRSKWKWFFLPPHSQLGFRMFQSEESFCLCREFWLWDNIAITLKLYSLYEGNAVELLLDKIHLWTCFTKRLLRLTPQKKVPKIIVKWGNFLNIFYICACFCVSWLNVLPFQIIYGSIK